MGLCLFHSASPGNSSVRNLTVFLTVYAGSLHGGPPDTVRGVDGIRDGIWKRLDRRVGIATYCLWAQIAVVVWNFN